MFPLIIGHYRGINIFINERDCLFCGSLEGEHASMSDVVFYCPETDRFIKLRQSFYRREV